MDNENIQAQGIQLAESLDLTEARVDAENRVIHDVVLIRAGRSSNRREYPAAVLESAVTVFEGAKAYADHPDKPNKPRNVRDITGWYENVRYDNGALRASRHFTPNSAGMDVWALAEIIATGKAPANLAGLSINAVGTGKVIKTDDGDIVEVESITAALSVDDVSTPAAKGGYALVASEDGTLLNDYLDVLSYEQWLESRSDYVERLKREWKAVRLEDETKRVLAEAGENVKAAETKAGEATQALSEAETRIKQLTDEREAAVQEAASKARELAVMKALRAVKLPAAWLTGLEESLTKANPDEWDSLIANEITKAKNVNAMPKVPVSGVRVQEAAVPKVSAVVSYEPLPNENVDDWQARIRSYKRGH